MQVTIKKWGNSSSIRLPVSVMKQISLHPDDVVDIKVENNQIVITPIKKVKYQYNLEELLSQITPENIHDKVEFGKRIGKELL